MALKLKAINKVGKLKCTYGRILPRKNIEKVGREEASLCLPPSTGSYQVTNHLKFT
jgi:hypothetical protein